MNSSKVFKKTSSFIPEKIISQRKKADSGWKTEAIPVEQVRDHTLSGNAPQRQAISFPGHDFPGSEKEGGLESPGKMDFSAPDSSTVAHRDTEPSGADDEEQGWNLDRIREVAYEKGLKDGLRMAEEDFGSSAKALALACENINTLRETILNNSMADMQNLVLIIAEKIIRHSVTEQDRTIADTVAEAIQHAVKSDEFLIQVNPADLDIIKSKSKEFIGSISGLENIVVQANPAIERGGCRIDSSTSTVDATIAGQLRIIEDNIKGKT
jgi:flagellar assembly protein FliH